MNEDFKFLAKTLGLSAGAGVFIVSKFLMNSSTKKSAIAALVIGGAIYAPAVLFDEK